MSPPPGEPRRGYKRRVMLDTSPCSLKGSSYSLASPGPFLQSPERVILISHIAPTVATDPSSSYMRLPKLRPRLSPLWSAIPLLLMGLAYLLRPDWSYALTIWPAMVWVVPGLLLASLSKRLRWAVVLGWLAFALVFVEDIHSGLRTILPSPRRAIRVVSLNCAGGLVEAAREVTSYRPDIVLLQESPGRAEVEALAKELYGEGGTTLVGPDAAILSRCSLTPLRLPRTTHNFVVADVQIGKERFRIVSLRLAPPTLRFDLLNADAWRDYAANKTRRRQEVREMLATLRNLGPMADIAGGDFNTPPDHQILGQLGPELQDSFAQAGRGYGSTAVNPWPLVRIDQVWSGPRLVPVSTTAHNTVNSDHRLVVADFAFR